MSTTETRTTHYLDNGLADDRAPDGAARWHDGHDTDAAVGTVLKPDTIYVAFDRFVCASIRCAGSTATASGHDIDGHRLREIDTQDIAEWASYDLGPLRCECGAVTEGA